MEVSEMTVKKIGKKFVNTVIVTTFVEPKENGLSDFLKGYNKEVH